MKIAPFALERWQSVWENRVAYNLSESGVHPLALTEVLDADSLARLAHIPLGYPQTNGTPALRSAIADLYPGAGPDNVLVTNGTSEANFVSAWALVEPGDEVVLMTPNYLQLEGLARSLGATVRSLPLVESAGWSLDRAALDKLVGPKTRLIAVNNPNNPTGAVLGERDRAAVVTAAARVGAWILADEVYRGAERTTDTLTPTFWGQYDRVLATGGLSKAYGLPGLRIGWVVAPADWAERLWGYHDYTTIAPSLVSDYIATAALTPPTRDRILSRGRGLIRANYPHVADWASGLGCFTWVPPEAGAIATLRYQSEAVAGLSSADLAERLLRRQSVLVVPGAQFGIEGTIRIGFGGAAAPLLAALERVTAAFARETV